jgi:hypothetical protein
MKTEPSQTGEQEASAPPQPVPAEPPPGWKLVPLEPTPEMLRAAVKMREGPAVYKVMSDGGLRTLEQEAADDYSAMLAATPLVQPPTLGNLDGLQGHPKPDANSC